MDRKRIFVCATHDHFATKSKKRQFIDIFELFVQTRFSGLIVFNHLHQILLIAWSMQMFKPKTAKDGEFRRNSKNLSYLKQMNEQDSIHLSMPAIPIIWPFSFILYWSSLAMPYFRQMRSYKSNQLLRTIAFEFQCFFWFKLRGNFTAYSEWRIKNRLIQLIFKMWSIFFSRNNSEHFFNIINLGGNPNATLIHETKKRRFFCKWKKLTIFQIFHSRT